MPFVPIPQVVQIVVEGHQGVDVWRNVLYADYFGGTGPPNHTDMDSLANVVLTDYAALIGSSQWPTTTTVDLVNTRDMTTIGSASGNASASAAGTTTQEVPAQNSALVSWHAPSHYRGGHSRTYLPAPISTVLASPQSWSSSFTTFVSTKMASIHGDINAFVDSFTNAYAHGVVHRSLAHAPIVPPSFEVITGFTVQAQVATQRRRIGR